MLFRRTLKAGIATAKAVSDLLAVSHRWRTLGARGAGARAIRVYLDAHPEVVGVWFDFAHAAGQERTPAEAARFKHMLGNVNLLYLGCRVLALLDISYLSRFWTQFEAWLSMQEGSSAKGLCAAPEGRRRVQMACLHNATRGDEDAKLQQMWGHVTPQEAHELLSKPDVTVTNQGDKVTQLKKIETLDGEVRGAWGVEAARGLRTADGAGGGVTRLPYGFSEAVLVEAGYTSGERVAVWASVALHHQDCDARVQAAEAFGGFGSRSVGRRRRHWGLAEGLRPGLSMRSQSRRLRFECVVAFGTPGELEATLAQHAAAIVARRDSHSGVRGAV